MIMISIWESERTNRNQRAYGILRQPKLTKLNDAKRHSKSKCTPTSKYNLSKCVNELLKSDHKEIKWNDLKSFISKTVAAFYIWRSRWICACEWDSQMVDREYKRTTKCKSSILIKMKTVGNFYFMIYSNCIYLCLTAEAMLVNEQTGGRTYTHTRTLVCRL